MQLIAKYWINGAIRPNGSPECGIHVAARSYSDWFHFLNKYLYNLCDELNYPYDLN